MTEDQRMELLARDRRENPIAYFKPRPHSVPFFMEARPDGRRFACTFLFGGNGSSKSWSLMGLCLMILTGIESVHARGCLKGRPKAPAYIRYHTPNLDVVSKDIVVPFMERWAPPGSWTYNKASHLFEFDNGSKWRMMSYNQALMSNESSPPDVEAFDEPPPKERFNAAWMRVSRTGGFIMGAMTLYERLVTHPIRWMKASILSYGLGRDVVSWHKLSSDENHSMRAQEVGGEQGERIAERYEQAKRAYEPEEFRARILGEATWLGGLVYPSFDKNIHRYDKASREQLCELARRGFGRVWCAVDHGKDHPTAVIWDFVACKPVDELDIAENDYIQFREYKVRNLNAADHIQAILNANEAMGIQPCGYICDPALWKDTGQGGPTIGQKYAAGLGMGQVPVIPGNNAKEIGWQMVEDLLRPRGGGAITWPQLRFLKGHSNETESEFETYGWDPKWTEGRSTDKDVDKDDDLMDDQRYMATFQPHKRGYGVIHTTGQAIRDPMSGYPLTPPPRLPVPAPIGGIF